VATLPELDPLEFLAAAQSSGSQRDPITATSLADLVTYLPCDLMTKVDVASMAHGLECRQPFLDHRVVELAARMPLGLKFRRGRGKRILLRAFADLLPPRIRRRRKMGFGVPLDHWFRNELRGFAREILLDPRTLGRGYFRPETVRGLVEDQQHPALGPAGAGTLAAAVGGPLRAGITAPQGPSRRGDAARLHQCGHYERSMSNPGCLPEGIWAMYVPQII
jgi:hypothetical protein